MPATMIRFSVRFDPALELEAVLDMLRYDGARIAAWRRLETDAGERYELALEGDRLTTERWASFGLRPQVSR